ncbi:MAG: M14 family metallopeptidase [Candidatus Aminicenantales bacterium]
MNAFASGTCHRDRGAGFTKAKVCFSALLFFMLAFPLLHPHNNSSPEIISIARSPELVRKIQKWGFDFLMEYRGRIYIVASPTDLARLESAGIPFRYETVQFSSSTALSSSAPDGINGKFHSYTELEKDLQTLQNNYPQIAKVFDIGDSLEKRNIYALKISDHVEQEEEEAEILFLGNHHAREWITVEVPFLLGKYLVENYASLPEVKSLVDQSEIWIVPLVNPDGLEYTIHYYCYWRKNRRNNGDGSYGVDLNRNYGYMWGYDDKGSNPASSSETYRGTAPFSEPETQAVRDFFLRKNFQAMISYHSFSQIILYPWGYTVQPSDKNELLNEIAAQMSVLIQQVHGNFYEYGQAGQQMYLTNGDTTDWTYGISGIPSYTIELPPVDELSGGFFNAEEDIERIFQENLPAMLYLIEYVIQYFQPPEGLRPPGPSKTVDKIRRIR